MKVSEIDIFKLLADENRLRIIVLMLDRELCMTHIYLGLNLKQSNTSRNLKILKEKGLVTMRTKKNNRYFKINEDVILENKEIFIYLRKLKLTGKYLIDERRMNDVEKCGCRGECECKL